MKGLPEVESKFVHFDFECDYKPEKSFLEINKMQREEAIEESKSEIVEEEIPNGNEEYHKEEITEKKVSWEKLSRFDSLDVEARKINGCGDNQSKDGNWGEILRLAFQSIGIVYGDLGTSPLYVLSSTFSNGIKHNDDMLGVLSLIFYTLTLLLLIKYMFIVLKATDNGDGGTFALYSLLCRQTRVGLIPSEGDEDNDDDSTDRLELPNHRLQGASWFKSKLENSHFAKLSLLLTTMLGTSMLLGDGILTPCISVLSAVGGLKGATTAMTEGMIVWISTVILICLFMVQRLGTDKVGYIFAPVLCIWFLFIFIIGIYNTIRYDPSVLKAINPKYIFDYFKRNKKEAWVSLGGAILCVTGHKNNEDMDTRGSSTINKLQNMALNWVIKVVVARCGKVESYDSHKGSGQRWNTVLMDEEVRH